MNRSLQYGLFLCFGLCLTVLLLIGCAKMGTLSGGPKDMRSPRLDTALSVKNFQTNFYPEVINLYFDEWIELRNSSQILISPPLEKNPVINSRGKHVEVLFDEEEDLRDSTTYAINFGDAIVDFTEANPVKNFRFVFATGDKIDSLVLSFEVVDAYTGEPENDVTVMLYDQYRDSIVYQEKPYYFARTDKTGLCSIFNLRAGKFKCFALLDSNFDFLYNNEKELIGFPDSLITLRPDSAVQRIEIELFQPIPPLYINEVDIVRKGKLKLVLNQPVDSIPLLEINKDLLATEFLQDSIIYWYEPDTSSTDSIFMVLDIEGKPDTNIIKSKLNTSLTGPMEFSSFKSRKVKINPGNPAILEFNQIISSLDTSYFDLQLAGLKPTLDTIQQLDTIRVDTIFPEPVYLDFEASIDPDNQRRLLIESSFKQTEQYELTLYPGGVNGYFDNTNDTLFSEISLELAENLGNIYCVFDSLDSTQFYLVLLKLKDRVIDQTTIQETETAKVEFLQQNPGKYYLEVIVDDNHNGRWDPGNYEQKKQSERKLEIKLDELRKGWDLETEIKWDGP